MSDPYRHHSSSRMKTTFIPPKEEKDPDNKRKPPSTKNYIRQGIDKLKIMINNSESDKSRYKALQRTLIKLGNNVNKDHPETFKEIATAVDDINHIVTEKEEHEKALKAFLELLSLMQDGLDHPEWEDKFLKKWKTKREKDEKDKTFHEHSPSLPRIRE